MSEWQSARDLDTNASGTHANINHDPIRDQRDISADQAKSGTIDGANKTHIPDQH